jgi:transglutaminase-like putative cysteine protease
MDDSLRRIKSHRVSFLLLLLMYLNLTWAIHAADWSEGLEILPWAPILALTIGSLLALSRWSAFLAGLYSAATGFICILLLMCSQLSADLAWLDRVFEVSLRTRKWIGVLISGEVNYDNLVFVLQLAIYLWLFSSLSAWGLFRRGRVWWAIAPPGVGLLINLYYAPPSLSAYFVLFLLLALVLVVHTNFQRREQEWASRRVSYTSDVSFDFLRDGVVIALLVIVLAWTLPGHLDIEALTRIGDRFERPWNTLQSEWSRMFASLTSHNTREELAFGRIMTFSGAVSLSDTPVMDITAREGRYWRAVAYDFYGGRGWASTYEELGPLGAETSPIAPPPQALRISLEQTIQVLLPSTYSIVAAAQPYQVDVPSEALLMYLPRDGATAARPPADMQLIYSQTRLRKDDVYSVVSSVSRADVQSLREAGVDYPEWITEHYLQLPSDLPRRVHNLVRQITQDLDNNYDRSVAIERYLRQIPYNEQIEAAPPSHRDAVDYFLFEMGEGYCDYYASAMAVMARVAGIPARLVQGYAEDEHVPGTNTFHIAEEDGHAWTELFFPGYGWVEFEATAAENIIERPERVPAPPADPPQDLPDENAGNDPLSEDRFGPEDDILGDLGDYSAIDAFLQRYGRVGRSAAIAILALAMLVGLGWALLRIMEPRRLTPPQRGYYRMTRYARVLAGRTPSSRHTPFEYARSLAAEVPYASQEILALVDLYVRDQFAATLPAEEAAGATMLWRRVLPGLWRRAGERFLTAITSRVLSVWRAIRRLNRPRAADGRYAG